MPDPQHTTAKWEREHIIGHWVRLGPMVDRREPETLSNCAFDVVFSFSVLQHFSPDNAKRAIAEIGRVLKPGGFAKVQMAQRLGARNLYVQAKRGFRRARDLEVRYCRLVELRNAFERAIGPTSIARIASSDWVSNVATLRYCKHM